MQLKLARLVSCGNIYLTRTEFKKDKKNSGIFFFFCDRKLQLTFQMIYLDAFKLHGNATASLSGV